MKDKQPKLSIGCRVNRETKLTDLRFGRYGDFFGNIEQVARQYGISIEDGNGFLIFSGPRLRLQMFAEKLHFSGRKYFDI